ncbi:MAG: hypothetical protein Q8N55_00770 [bacterium]|nr:hypothetical protein [bacterium]
MATQAVNDKITLSKSAVQIQNGMVVLPLQEYKRLCEDAAIITYHLKGKEAEKLDCLVRDGMNEYKAGKCKTIKSLADLD